MWTQGNEMTFLEKLGTFTNQAPKEIRLVASERRIKLLRGYIESIDKRTNWFSGARPDRLRAHAERLIERAQAA